MLFKIQTGQITITPINCEYGKVSYYAKIYLKLKKQSIKLSTLRRYESVLNTHILPTFGNDDIDSIKVSRLRIYFHQLQSKISGKTIDIIMIVFNGIFQEALYDEAIEKNPFSHIRRIKTKSQPANPLSKDEVKTLLNSANGWFKNFLGVAFFSGMRTGEIIGLKWSDIDWQEKELHIQRSRGDGGVESTPKTLNSMRIIPIFDEMMPYLKSQYEITKKHNSYIFLNYKSEPFSDSHRIRDYHWKKLLNECNIPYRRLYDTRSTFATQMVSSNKFSVNLIAQILGHTDVSMLFRRYNKFIKSEVRLMDKKLGIL